MELEITKAELIEAKRAVVYLSALAKIAVEFFDSQEPPIDVKQDQMTLIKLLRKCEKVAV